jgi:hypothetical protein
MLKEELCDFFAMWIVSAMVFIARSGSHRV